MEPLKTYVLITKFLETEQLIKKFNLQQRELELNMVKLTRASLSSPPLTLDHLDQIVFGKSNLEKVRIQLDSLNNDISNYSAEIIDRISYFPGYTFYWENDGRNEIQNVSALNLTVLQGELQKQYISH